MLSARDEQIFDGILRCWLRQQQRWLFAVSCPRWYLFFITQQPRCAAGCYKRDVAVRSIGNSLAINVFGRNAAYAAAAADIAVFAVFSVCLAWYVCICVVQAAAASVLMTSTFYDALYAKQNEVAKVRKVISRPLV